LSNRIAEPGWDEGDSATLVPCVTLDEAVAGTQFAMGKMDIEGAEPVIFRGSREALSAANPPVWLLEIKDRLMARYGCSASHFAAFLRQHGFQLGSFDARQGRLSFTDEPWKGRENVIAVHHSAMHEVCARLAQHG
jgi:hypothetical protein